MDHFHSLLLSSAFPVPFILGPFGFQSLSYYRIHSIYSGFLLEFLHGMSWKQAWIPIRIKWYQDLLSLIFDLLSFFFCLPSIPFQRTLPYIRFRYKEESERVYWGFWGGPEGFTPPNPQETPSQPPGNPQATPSERWTDDTLKKKMRLHSNLKYIRYYNLFRI